MTKYLSSGIEKPQNWDKLSYAQRKLVNNFNKPSLGTIYYCIHFKNGTKKFAISKGKSIYNLTEFEENILKSWPNSIEIQIFDSENEYNKAKSKF